MLIDTSKGKRQYDYRLIFIYSSGKAKADRAMRQKWIGKLQKEISYVSSRLNKRGYRTHQEVTSKLSKIFKFHVSKLFDIKILGDDGNLSLSYDINPENVSQAQALDGIYIIKTNLPKSKYTITDVLTLYKNQGQIESKIADLKGPLQVAPIYLKKPERILSLFTIVVQALKIYTLVEREVHQAVDENQEPIPILPENRNSYRPKAHTILRIFDEDPVTLTKITFSDNSYKIYISSLSTKQKMFFQFIKRKPLDQRNFSRKIGFQKLVYKFAPG